MKIHIYKGAHYRVPNELNDFQLDMYVHLIKWKWKHLTEEPGYHRSIPYDAILPDQFKAKYLPIYEPVVDRFLSHQKRFPFKIHTFIGHMASSQAACANLFLPLLQHPDAAAEALRAVKPDLHRIATEHFDSGYRLEFWDEPDNMLNDHNAAAGTDADIAIAYYDKDGNLKLWLIEHKLSEREFTTCGGYRSRGRNKLTHKCDSAADIVKDKRLCYYHSVSGYKYWDITFSNPGFFTTDRLLEYGGCPFQGGLNQLWRNQLLALAVEASKSPRWPFSRVYFSVVHHPKNCALDETIRRFRRLIGMNDSFSTFTSDMLVNQARRLDFAPWKDWLDWFEELYYY